MGLFANVIVRYLETQVKIFLHKTGYRYLLKLVPVPWQTRLESDEREGGCLFLLCVIKAEKTSEQGQLINFENR